MAEYKQLEYILVYFDSKGRWHLQRCFPILFAKLNILHIVTFHFFLSEALMTLHEESE